MDMKILTPAQVFINGKFFCIVDEVEIKYQDAKFRKSLIPENPMVSPDEAVGTVIHIKRKARTKQERDEVEKEKKSGDYDAFFNRMVDASNDPDAHVPIDTSDI